MKDSLLITRASGNAIFLVLLGIVLFAALGFAMSQGSRGAGQNLTKEMQELYSSEIVEYSNKLRNALMTMQAIGCSDTQISFERSPFDGSDTDYVNPLAPSDFSCHMFHPKGGGMKPHSYSGEVYDTAATLNAQSFNAQNRINNVGTTTAELVYFVSGIQEDLCLKINDKLGLGSVHFVDNDFTVGGSGFTGTYGPGDINFANIAEGTAFEGQRHGCVHETTGCGAGSCYHYVRVLITK